MRSGVPGSLPAAGPRACARVQNKRKTGGRTAAARGARRRWKGKRRKDGRDEKKVVRESIIAAARHKKQYLNAQIYKHESMCPFLKFTSIYNCTYFNLSSKENLFSSPVFDVL